MLEGFPVNERRRQLLSHIDRAFAGVTLGDGVSLHESEVIDNDGTDEERRVAREPDEKTDWRRLVDHPDLTAYFGSGYGGLSFLDAAGVRFHLPACLSRVVRDFDNHDDELSGMFASLCWLLTRSDQYNRGRLAILGDEQRACVRECLVLFREALASNDSELDRAIDYWSKPASD